MEEGQPSSALEGVDGARKSGENRPSGLNLAGTPQPRPSSNLPFIVELLSSRLRGSGAGTPSHPTTALDDTLATPSDTTPTLLHTGVLDGEGRGVKVLKIGNLHKTSQSRSEQAVTGPTRVRRFRLTPETLEYFQHFSQVKVRRNYPLTSVEDIVFPAGEDSCSFQLLFSTYVMTLRADSATDASEWVEAIRSAWKEWQLPDVVAEGDEEDPLAVRMESPPLNPTAALDTISEEREGEEEEGECVGPQQATSPAKKHIPSMAPFGAKPDPLVTPGNEGGEYRPRSLTHSGVLRRFSSETDMYTYDRRKLSRRARKIKKAAKLAPRLTKQDPHKHFTTSKLHSEYAMIKYPHARWSIPSEKIFKLDKDNLMIIWRRNETSQHKLKSALSLHKVLEIREGQLTKKFDQFPYEEVEEQSFSLIMEEMTKKYVRLTSLDLICDSPESYNDWIHELRDKTNHLSSTIFPSEQYENTDPTILWLKKLWTVSQNNHEMSQKVALGMVTTFQPSTSPNIARSVLLDSHHYQFRHTYLRGNALRWDGFVLMFNLICGMEGDLATLYRRYAVKRPRLGLKEEELKEFLMQECHWEESDCSPQILHSLISRHDFHHRAFKKYVANGSPTNYQIGSTLLSYAGFLSFLRSKDNSVINLEHTSVYQDMDQPLSHYFINSSHNTYLEADQLYGASSTDAYIRVLLQGCRCIEIDCWDDTLNVTGVSEPIIYHGFTLTTKLPFREVIRTIKEYAFTASMYPLIISIENHCSSQQQSKMAKIFHAIMGDVLVKENLVEMEGRDRLPSPVELQGKVVLKGSLKTKNLAGKKAKSQGDMKFSLTTADVEASSSLPPSALLPSSPTSKEPVETTAVSLLRSKNKFFSKRSVRHRIQTSVHETETIDSAVYQDDDQELIFEETAEDLKKLIVYCRSMSIKPWSFERQRQTQVYDMFSFGEPSALRRSEKYPQEMLACTERQLVRTYPRGTRFDSSNYSAMHLWRCGVQMVALNFQYPDVYMHLNQGLFRHNGGCGYVLKPAVMRPRDGRITFDPKMEEPHPDVPPVNLEIELLSGQQLCFWEKKCVSVSVDIQSHGISHDCGEMPTATSLDLFWPQWGKGKHVLKRRILMPELCLIYFKVDVVIRGAARKTVLYGQNCLPLECIMPGIKFVPLRTAGGELIPESGLFLRITKEVEGEGGKEGGRRRKLSRQSCLPDKSREFQGIEIPNVDVMQSLLPFARRQPFLKQEESEPNTSSHLSSLSATRETMSPWRFDVRERGRGGGGGRGGREGRGGGGRVDEHQRTVVAEVHDYNNSS